MTDGRLKAWTIAGTLLLVSACSGEPASPVPAEGATLAPASVAAAGPAGCANGALLPVTGLCNTAAASLFVAIDDTIETFATRCIWRTEEVLLSPGEALVFRAQDCSPEGWVRTIYTPVSGYLKYRMDGTPDDQAGFALQVFPLAPGETAEAVAMKTLAQAPELERDRCETRANTINALHKLSGRTFDLEPKADFMAELEAEADGGFSACGPNGFTNEAVQVWEARPGHALFHMLGQDTPLWDPASFTFYRQAADGRWARAT